MSDPFGVAGEQLLQVVAAGGAVVAFRTANSVIVTEMVRSRVFDGAFTAIVGGAQKVSATIDGTVRLFTMGGMQQGWTAPGATSTSVDAMGNAVWGWSRDVRVGTMDGQSTLRFRAPMGQTVRSLTRAGTRVGLLVNDELALWDGSTVALDLTYTRVCLSAHRSEDVLEQLCRYMLRPPFAFSRLSVGRDGLVRCRIHSVPAAQQVTIEDRFSTLSSMSFARVLVSPAMKRTGVLCFALLAPTCAACGARTELSSGAGVGFDARVPADAQRGVDVPMQIDVGGPTDVPVGLDAQVRVDVVARADVPSALDVPTQTDGSLCAIGVDETLPVSVQITADDDYILFVNEQLVDQTRRPWTSPQTYRVTFFRHPQRRNVLAIQATNRANVDGLDRGLIADFSFRYPGSASDAHLLTDNGWRLIDGVVANFGAINLDDAAWPAAVDEGPHGIAPWGAILGVSAARWIWSFNSDRASGSKPIVQSVTARIGFYLGVDGTIHLGPQSCR